MNQCDGCQRGLPMVNNGFGGEIHQGNGKYDRIACTADRYKDRHANHINKALAKSLATEHAEMHFQGAYTVCPYKVGTAERAAPVETHDGSCGREVMGIKAGDTLDWRHGDSIRVAKVIKIEGDKVLLQGATKPYWLSMRSISEKIMKPEKIGVNPFSANP